jgi:hypothetical protein
MCSAPLDQNPSLKGGPYSQGVYKFRRSESGFGFVTVEDRGDRIDVRYSGRNQDNNELIGLQFTVPAAKSSDQTRIIR